MSNLPPLPPLPDPCDYVYEWFDSGHRSLRIDPYNGRHCDYARKVFDGYQMRTYARAAIAAAAAAPPAEAQESPLDRLVREQQAMGLYDDAMPPADPEVEALKCEIERLRGALKQAREHLAVFPESMGFGLDILPVIDRALAGTKEGSDGS
jgi:hypothetical protein